MPILSSGATHDESQGQPAPELIGGQAVLLACQFVGGSVGFRVIHTERDDPEIGNPSTLQGIPVGSAVEFRTEYVFMVHAADDPVLGSHPALGVALPWGFADFRRGRLIDTVSRRKAKMVVAKGEVAQSLALPSDPPGITEAVTL